MQESLSESVTGQIPDISKYAHDIASVVMQPEMQKVYTIYDKVSRAMREYLSDVDEFLEFKPPLIGPVTDPGIRGSKQVEVDYYGKEYKFMSSAILYKQLLSISRYHAGFPGKIYFFADNLRLEPMETANTDRHLTEFIQVDLEVVDADHIVAMDVAEKLVKYVYKKMKEIEPELKEIRNHFKEESTKRGLKHIEELKIPETPFKRYTFREIVTRLKEYIKQHPEVIDEMRTKFGVEPHKLDYKTELTWEYEWLASSLHDEPFFTYDYPKGARGFYDREYQDGSKLLMDFDLIFPYGYGEAISGAAREYEIERIIPRMKETGENIKKYEWYLKFLKQYGMPTAGFGIGLERTVRFFCGLPKILHTLPYPKIPGIYSP